MALTEKEQLAFSSLMDRLAPNLSAETMTTLRHTLGESEGAARLLAAESIGIQKLNEEQRNLAERRKQLDTTQAELAADRAKVAELTGKVQQYETYLRSNAVGRSEYEQALAEKQQLQHQLQQIQSTYDLDLTQFNASPQEPSMPTQPNGNTNGAPPASPFQYVTDTQFNQTAQQLMVAAALTPAVMASINAEHQRLFGEPIPDPEALVTNAMAQGKDLRTAWAETYEVSKRKDELQQQAFEQRVKAEVEKEVAQRISQIPLNGGGLPLSRMPQSPLLEDRGLPPEQRAVTAAPQFREGVAADAATRAYLEGKYKDQKFDILVGGQR